MSKSSKGSAFEREICTKLSLWWSDGKDDAIFWRTSGSGARATARKKKNKKTFGQSSDIQAINPDGQPLIDLFSIELKRGYSSATLMDILDKSEWASEQTFESFIKQAVEGHQNAGSYYWMLITKRNQRRALVTIPHKVLTDFCHIKEGEIDLQGPIATISAIVDGQKRRFSTVWLDDFLNMFSKSDMLELLQYNITL